jgi:hypothetical protein
VVRWGVSGTARHMATVGGGEIASGRLPGGRPKGPSGREKEGGMSASWRRQRGGLGREGGGTIREEYSGPQHGRAPPNVRH